MTPFLHQMTIIRKTAPVEMTTRLLQEKPRFGKRDPWQSLLYQIPYADWKVEQVSRMRLFSPDDLAFQGSVWSFTLRYHRHRPANAARQLQLRTCRLCVTPEFMCRSVCSMQANKSRDLAGTGSIPGAVVDIPAADLLGAELGCHGACHLLHILPLWHLHLHLLHGHQSRVRI